MLPYFTSYICKQEKFHRTKSLDIILFEPWLDSVEIFEELILWWKVVPYKAIVIRLSVIKKETMKSLERTKNQNVQKNSEIFKQLKINFLSSVNFWNWTRKLEII